MKYEQLVQDVGFIHERSREAAGRSVDQLLTMRNWLIGANVIEYEQNGEDRAQYGTKLLSRLATSLTEAGHQGLGHSSLKNCRQVVLAYPELQPGQMADELLPTSAKAIWQTSAKSEPDGPKAIRQTSGEFENPQIRQTSGESSEAIFPSLRARADASETLEWRDDAWLSRLFTRLTFSHILELSRIDAPLQRAFYELHCLKEGWSTRELKRQRGSLLFERIGLSKDKAGLMALAQEGALSQTPKTVLRDPYVLEFLDLGSQARFTESDLEQALLNHLQAFLLELGSDFCFMGRQYRISTGSGHYYLDLLFYHRGLNCLVAIDLKVEAFRHEQAGQMNFYVNYLADNVAREGENRPIGVILCTDKDASEVHYATAGIEDSVFVSRYLAQLPSEEQLARWLKEERALLETHVGPSQDRAEGDDG